MKFQVMFKTPDAVENAISEELNRYRYDEDGNRIEESLEEKYEREDKIKELKEFVSQWVQYGECITVIFDTNERTCKVMK